MDTGKGNILVVDDDPGLLSTMESWLSAAGYSLTVTSVAVEARKLLSDESFALVISHYAMPGLSGTDALALAHMSEADTAVLFTASSDDREAVAPLVAAGADGYVIKPLVKNDLLVHVAKALEHRRRTVAGGEPCTVCTPNERAQAWQDMQREEEIVFRLASALGVRTDDSQEHVRRVGLNAALVAKHLGWNPDAVADIRLAAALHDIGETGVPDSILLKPGKLSAEEFALIKKHTEIGSNLLEGSSVSMIRMAREIALCHHEKWDGTGYPKGLAGEDIPEAARIVAVVDVYDALVSQRVYRPPLPQEEALSIMIASREKYFDPRVLDCFLRLLPEIDLVNGTELHETELTIDFEDSKTEL